MQPHTSLARHAEIRRQLRDSDRRDGLADPDRKPLLQKSAAGITRTALCVEPRGGTLYVFMPPTEKLEDYLELVAAVEATADALQQPVIVEGYEPPRDPRLNSFRITPDPGVIEVNVHPANSWKDLVGRTTHFTKRRAKHSTTEKFMVDGRHTGTGGGNHFVLGGESPADSPFLRRPICSRACWLLAQPSLAVVPLLGMFVGPTSRHRASTKHAKTRC